jgi:hypothetical protein
MSRRESKQLALLRKRNRKSSTCVSDLCLCKSSLFFFGVVLKKRSTNEILSFIITMYILHVHLYAEHPTCKCNILLICQLSTINCQLIPPFCSKTAMSSRKGSASRLSIRSNSFDKVSKFVRFAITIQTFPKLTNWQKKELKCGSRESCTIRSKWCQ